MSRSHNIVETSTLEEHERKNSVIIMAGLILELFRMLFSVNLLLSLLISK